MTSSTSLPGFVSSEWEVLQLHPHFTHVPHDSSIEALAFSVAAQVPGGRWVADKWLEESISERLDERSLARKAGRRHLSLVVCSENSHRGWTFTTWPDTEGRDPLYYVNPGRHRPIQVLIKRVQGGFRAMRRKSWKMGAWDPLPMFGYGVDERQKQVFRERTTAEQLTLSSTVTEDHRRRRRRSPDILSAVASDYRAHRVDPQTFACSRDEVEPLIEHWRRDVRAGSYRPLQSWAFHWHGFLSTLTPAQRERPLEVTVDGLDRLELWERWDAEFRRHLEYEDAEKFPGSLHYGG